VIETEEIPSLVHEPIEPTNPAECLVRDPSHSTSKASTNWLNSRPSGLCRFASQALRAFVNAPALTPDSPDAPLIKSDCLRRGNAG